MSSNPQSHVIATGFALPYADGDTNCTFTTDKPYCGCLRCGQVFQSPLDLSVPPAHTPDNSLIARLAYERRLRWRKEHRCPTPVPHKIKPGTFASPYAAQKLASIGMFSLMDLCLDDEVSSALAESKGDDYPNALL